MPTSASPACQVCLSQDDVDCRFSLAIRNDQVDPQTRLPRILGGCFVLIKSTKIVQTADLCHGEPPVNSSFCKVELDRVQGCCINNSFNLLHIEISRRLVIYRWDECGFKVVVRAEPAASPEVRATSEPLLRLAKRRRPNAEPTPVFAAKPVMRCGVDLSPNFTERGIGNSFHGIIIPSSTVNRSPQIGGNEPFLGRLTLMGLALAISERTQTDRKRLNCFDRAWMNKYYLA